MTKHEASIWYLFKECFNFDWVAKQCPVTLFALRDFLTPLLEEINRVLECYK